jgi:hypothetical protein
MLERRSEDLGGSGMAAPKNWPLLCVPHDDEAGLRAAVVEMFVVRDTSALTVEAVPVS